MKTFRLPLAIAALAAPFVPAAAQTSFTIQQVTDSDRLAEQMRVLAVSPTNLTALIGAGELTLKLGDTTAARNLFVRADRVSPRDARVKAGMGKVSVQLERPGEALRLFAEAESMGLAPTGSSNPYAAERGLAYDLVGQQQRAQRDYRAALKIAPDDEITRRLALSLGISGQRDAAFALLDPLLRKSDRGAWRSRAFILAMGGDIAGADKIAVNMMPPGMAQGLAPFFQRLPTLSAVDRAFAVHFGEVRPTTERLADARLVPPLAPLPPEPVQVAAVVATKPVKPAKPAKKPKRGAVQVAVAIPAPTPPEPEPPRYVAQMVQSVPTPYVAPPRSAAIAATPMAVPSRPTSAIPAESATRVMVEPTRSTTPVARVPAAPVPVVAAPRLVQALPVQQVPTAIAPRQVAPAPPAPIRPVPTQPVQAQPVPTQPAPTQIAAAPQPAAVVPTPVSPAATAPVSTPVVPTPVVQPQRSVDVTPTQAPASAAARPLPAAPRRVPGSEDSILAAIVANISVPGSELGVEAPVRPKPPEPPEPVIAAVAPEPAPVAIRPIPEKKLPVVDEAAARKKAAADEAAAKKKAIADKKALAAKKAAAEELAEEKRAAAEQKKLEKADPVRIWVQVSGGATESDLAKAWKQVSGKAPEAFRGRSGWTTPLRATNRVLTGPFKTDAEARTFVNKLAKEGVSAFTFTSTVGQKITRLAK